MAERDAARSKGLATYKELRNRCNVRVASDKRRSNSDTLRKAGDCPRALWQIADSALGKNRPALPVSLSRPDGSETETALETAELVNAAYVSKVEKLRSTAAPVTTQVVPDPTPVEIRNDDDNCPAWPPPRRPFSFSFASASKVARTIQRLKSTEALGIDEIPVSVLKKSVDTLASPIAHLCNRSLATGVVPSGFKVGRLSPIFKGGGKSRKEPASYRPVAILPAMSKILEQIVKVDLEAHLRNTGGLPNAQFGFRPRRGCTSALGTAHAGWINSLKARTGVRTQVVGIMSYDLSAAFDTVGVEELKPKLVALGITGRALDWFESYLTGGSQCVVWNGAVSSRIEVRFGVRQGSILGPVLFITLMSDLPAFLKTKNIVIYADDINLWICGHNAEDVAAKLTEMATLVSSYARKNGLALNAGKTQLLFSKGAGKTPPTVRVGDVDVVPGDTLELLGVTFDRALSTAPHDARVLTAARQRAALIARLGHHLPRGRYLRQLATGLFGGKIGHALAAVVPPRLAEADTTTTAKYKAVQICQNNVARTITGTARSEHVTVCDLLETSGLQSINRQAVAAVAMEAWNSFHSDDGEGGGRNPLGLAIFGEEAPNIFPVTALAKPKDAPASDLGMPQNCPKPALSQPVLRPQRQRTTRASEAGHTHIKMRGVTTLATHAGMLWNASPSLRLATTRGEAKIAAKALARAAPL
jgi:hypothetical protein